MLYILPYTLKQTTNYSTVKLLILGAICIIISYFFTQPIISILGLVNKHLLPISVSVIFLGIFMLITRLSKLTQFIGLAIAEHGMFLTATSLSGGMPTIVEVGILFDGIMGVALAFYLIRRVSLYKEENSEVKELP
jgi:hydrogenase-4 component E